MCESECVRKYVTEKVYWIASMFVRECLCKRERVVESEKENG